MVMYFSHSKAFDYKKELYVPLRSSVLNERHTLILPHEDEETPFSTKELFISESCDFVIADVSFPATGQGIELGWADLLHIPILCMYKLDTKISGSLYLISNKFMEYTSSEDMIEKLEDILRKYEGN